MVKNPPAMHETHEPLVRSLDWEDPLEEVMASLEEGMRYSRLEKPTDRGAWRARVHRVAKNQTQLSMRAQRLL